METLIFDWTSARLDETSLPVTVDTLINLSAVKASWQVATKMGLKNRDSSVKKSIWFIVVFSKLMYFKENYIVHVQIFFKNIYIKKQLK